MATSIVQNRAGLSNKKDAARIAAVQESLRTDIAALRAAFVALTAKLDTNHGAATDHAATLNPAAMNTTA